MADLIASKVVSYAQRRGSPKSGTDWRDLGMLLLSLPELKQESGSVADLLMAMGVASDVMDAWHDLVAQDIQPGNEDDEF